MIHTIENDYLRVSVDDHGAELCSIFDKVHNREVIWQADPAYWKRHAPVLFPNVGRHFEDHYRINGVEYPSSQHGFARDSEFTCVDMTADSITSIPFTSRAVNVSENNKYIPVRSKKPLRNSASSPVAPAGTANRFASDWLLSGQSSLLQAHKPAIINNPIIYFISLILIIQHLHLSSRYEDYQSYPYSCPIPL